MFERRSLFNLLGAVTLALGMALPAAAQTVLPTGFTGKAVGDGGGSIKDEGGKLTIQGEGADIGDVDQDHMFFVSQEITGNGHLTARLNSATGGAEDGGEKAGLMIRGDLDPDAAHALIHEQDENHGLALRWREEKGGDTAVEAGYARRTFPLWLRIQRVGNQVTGFFSTDGQLWSATSTKTVALGSAAHFGIAVSSHEDERMMTTEWDNVSVGTNVLVTGLQACGNENGVALTWQPVEGATGYLVFRGAANTDRNSVKQDQLVQISASPVAAGTTTYADTDSALQPGARAIYAVAPVMADGTPGPRTIVLAGKAGPPVSPLPDYTVTVFGDHQEGDCAQGSTGAAIDPATGVITLRGGGLDFWSGGEHSVWLSRPQTGNFRATVQILDFPLGVNPCCGKAGLFVRETLDRDSRYAGAALRTDGLRQQKRLNAEGATDDSEGPFILDRDAARVQLRTGLFLRVEREGDEIRTLYSLDGTTFEPIDEPVILEGLANGVHVGIALGARDRDAPIQNRLSEAQFKIISVEPL